MCPPTRFDSVQLYLALDNNDREERREHHIHNFIIAINCCRNCVGDDERVSSEKSELIMALVE